MISASATEFRPQAMANNTPPAHTIALGPKFVDQVTFERYEPRFRKDENCKRELNRRPTPMVFLIDRIDKKRPRVLQISDHRHADDAQKELNPASRPRSFRVSLCVEQG